ALYSITRTDEGCEKVLSRNPESDCLSALFKGKENEAVAKVAQYASVAVDVAEGQMENIADEAIKIVRDSAGKDPKPEKIKTYMNDQRHHILVYLPAKLNMGDLLKDESLDDRTTQMEEP